MAVALKNQAGKRRKFGKGRSPFWVTKSVLKKQSFNSRFRLFDRFQRRDSWPRWAEMHQIQSKIHGIKSVYGAWDHKNPSFLDANKKPWSYESEEGPRISGFSGWTRKSGDSGTLLRFIWSGFFIRVQSNAGQSSLLDFILNEFDVFLLILVQSLHLRRARKY